VKVTLVGRFVVSLNWEALLSSLSLSLSLSGAFTRHFTVGANFFLAACGSLLEPGAQPEAGQQWKRVAGQKI